MTRRSVTCSRSTSPAFRLIRAALPYLRTQGSGHIVNMASIAGVAPSMGAGFYGATKAALAALAAMSYSLAAEVSPFGLWVSVVSPGAFRTAAERAYRAYRAVDEALANWSANDGRQAGDPASAAAAMLRIVAANEPPMHYAAGSDAVKMTRDALENRLDELDRWRQLSESTDPDQPVAA